MKVVEYLEKTTPEKEYGVRPRIVCKDGFSISVQGGNKYSYCSPRENCNSFWLVELGFPSEPIPDFLEYRDGDIKDEDNVFGYVPIEKVEALIESHGGIVDEVTP